MKIDIDPGYGFVEFAIGESKTAPIDLYALHDYYCSLLEKHAEEKTSDALWADWRTHLESLKFPAGLSLAALVKVKDSVGEAVRDLRKKDPQPAA